MSYGKIVYIASLEAIVNVTYEEWKTSFENIIEDIQVVKLTGILQTDLKLLQQGNIILATSEQWDVLSRRWMKRKHVQKVSMLICDEIHLLSESKNQMEVVISRMRYMASELGRPIRFIALGSSVANYKVMAEWIGARDVYNFMPNARPIPLEINVHNFDHNIQALRMLSMSKPAYHAIKRHFENKPIMIFVPNRKQARLVALDMTSFASSDDNPHIFLGNDEQNQIKR
jgi:pre-mRNA-splicing helicase BRR2